MPTVGLVGSRNIDQGLQSSNKKTVTDFAFPKGSRSADAIGHCPEGKIGYDGPKTGDSYDDGVENTGLQTMFFVLLGSVLATLALTYVQ